MKVLFCSPFSDAPTTIKGGVNTWGRYIMSYYQQINRDSVELIPVSLDRSYFVKANHSIIHRIIGGYRDQTKQVKLAIRLMDSEKPEIAHICTSAGLGVIRDYLLVRAAKKRGIKTIVHLHFGRIPELAQQCNWEWKMLSKVLYMCDVPVVMNKPSERVLVEKGFKHVTYLSNPISMSVLDAIREMEGKYNRIPRRLLYCGHVVKNKGVMELVEGCSKIPNIELRFVGKNIPEVKEEMEALAKKASRDLSWLSFVGEVAHDEVLKEFFQADVFVFPSYSEGFPNVILEAMACGCPIASSDVGAIPEMLDVEGDACGICFKPHSADEVYRTVSLLIDDENKKKALASKAKVRVCEMYAMPKVWEQMVTIWKTSI